MFAGRLRGVDGGVASLAVVCGSPNTADSADVLLREILPFHAVVCRPADGPVQQILVAERAFGNASAFKVTRVVHLHVIGKPRRVDDGDGEVATPHIDAPLIQRPAQIGRPGTELCHHVMTPP